MSDGDRACGDRNDKFETGGSKRDSDGDKAETLPPGVRDVVDELGETELHELRRYVNAKLTAAENAGAEEDTEAEEDTGAKEGTVAKEETEMATTVTDESSTDGSKPADSAASEGTELQSGKSDEQPDGVPSKATRVVKEINDNRYYYWQWRDGDSVKSKYDRPVDSG